MRPYQGLPCKSVATYLLRNCTLVHARTACCMSRLPRGFVASPDAQKGTLAESATTVITYNLLAQKYIDDGAHTYCPPDHSSWASRWPKFERELKQYDADVLCLQEVGFDEAEVHHRRQNDERDAPLISLAPAHFAAG